jgi:hypothetical protein
MCVVHQAARARAPGHIEVTGAEWDWEEQIPVVVAVWVGAETVQQPGEFHPRTSTGYVTRLSGHQEEKKTPKVQRCRRPGLAGIEVTRLARISHTIPAEFFNKGPAKDTATIGEKRSTRRLAGNAGVTRDNRCQGQLSAGIGGH